MSATRKWLPLLGLIAACLTASTYILWQRHNSGSVSVPSYRPTSSTGVPPAAQDSAQDDTQAEAASRESVSTAAQSVTGQEAESALDSDVAGDGADSDAVVEAIDHPSVAVILAEPEAPRLKLLEGLALSMQEEQGVELVDRERLEQVMAEQELSAAGAVQRGAALRLGRLMAADILLIAELYENGGIRLRALATETGIVLIDAIYPGEQEVQIAEALGNVLQPAIRLHRLPEQERIYLAMAGITREADDPVSQRAAEALEPLIASALQQHPAVIVLDRQELHRLVREKAIDGDTRPFLGSAHLIEGSIRRANEDSVRLQLRVTSLPDGATEVESVTAGASELKQLRQNVVDLVLANTKVDSAAPAHAADVEAGWFMNRAAWLAKRGFGQKAMAAIEAALALDDDPKCYKKAAALIHWEINPERAIVDEPEDETSAVPYRRLLRLYELSRVASLHGMRHIDSRMVVARQVHERAVTPERRRLLDRIIAVERNLYRELLRSPEAAGRSVARIHLYQFECLGGLVANAEELNREAIVLADQWGQVLKEADDRARRAVFKRMDIGVLGESMIRRGGKANYDPARFSIEDVRPTIDHLANHEQPLLRLMGLYMLTVSPIPWNERLAAARELLDLTLVSDQLPKIAPREFDRWYVTAAVRVLGKQGQAHTWLENLLDRAKAGHYVPLVRYPRAMYEAIERMAYDEPRGMTVLEYRRKLYQRVIHVLDGLKPDEDMRENVESLRQSFAKEMQRIEELWAHEEETHDPDLLDQFRFTRLEAGGAVEGLKIPLVYHYDESENADAYGGPLIIGWIVKTEPIDKFDDWHIVHFTRSNVYGEKLHRVGKVRLHSDTIRTHGYKLSLDAIGEYLYVPTRRGLAIVSKETTRYLGTEQGAPSDRCLAVERIDGRRLLVAFGDTSLVWFDIKDETFTMIGSSREVGGENHLAWLTERTNGLKFMLYLSEVNCAYLAPSSSTNRALCFDIDTEAFTRIDFPSYHFYRLRYVRGDLIVRRGENTWRLNLKTNELESYDPEWWPQGNYRDEHGPLQPGVGIWLDDVYCFRNSGSKIEVYAPNGMTTEFDWRPVRFHRHVPEGLVLGFSWYPFTTRAPLLLVERRSRED